MKRGPAAEGAVVPPVVTLKDAVVETVVEGD